MVSIVSRLPLTDQLPSLATSRAMFNSALLQLLVVLKPARVSSLVCHRTVCGNSSQHPAVQRKRLLSFRAGVSRLEFFDRLVPSEMLGAKP